MLTTFIDLVYESNLSLHSRTKGIDASDYENMSSLFTQVIAQLTSHILSSDRVNKKEDPAIDVVINAFLDLGNYLIDYEQLDQSAILGNIDSTAAKNLLENSEIIKEAIKDPTSRSQVIEYDVYQFIPSLTHKIAQVHLANPITTDSEVNKGLHIKTFIYGDRSQLTVENLETIQQSLKEGSNDNKKLKQKHPSLSNELDELIKEKTFDADLVAFESSTAKRLDDWIKSIGPGVTEEDLFSQYEKAKPPEFKQYCFDKIKGHTTLGPDLLAKLITKSDLTPSETVYLLEQSIGQEKPCSTHLKENLLTLITPENGIVPDQKALLEVDQLVRLLGKEQLETLDLNDIKSKLDSLDCIGGYREGKSSAYDQAHFEQFQALMPNFKGKTNMEECFQALQDIASPEDKKKAVQTLYTKISITPGFYHECCTLIDIFGPNAKSSSDKILIPYTQTAKQATTLEATSAVHIIDTALTANENKTFNCVNMQGERGVSALYIDGNILVSKDPSAPKLQDSYKEKIQALETAGGVKAVNDMKKNPGYNVFHLGATHSQYKYGEEPRLDSVRKNLEEYCQSNDSDVELIKLTVEHGLSTKLRENLYVSSLHTIMGNIDEFLHHDSSESDYISIVALTKTKTESPGQGLLFQISGTKEKDDREFGEIANDGEILMFHGQAAHATGPSNADLKSMTGFRRPDEYVKFLTNSPRRMARNIRFELKNKETGNAATTEETNQFIEGFNEWLKKGSAENED